MEDASPDKVLSEGEKRAVALADFITEVALDVTSGGIILDDPVTSLDLEWRETIADILVKEAERRQVIVFTHDLPFLYFLKKHAEELGIDLATHWIKRGNIDGKPGYVYCNNCPHWKRTSEVRTRRENSTGELRKLHLESRKAFYMKDSARSEPLMRPSPFSTFSMGL